MDPASGPFLFDASAESWFGRATQVGEVAWMREYLTCHQVHISAVTVMEWVRGHGLLWRRAGEARSDRIEAARFAYVVNLGHVWPLNDAVAVVAGGIMALLPEPPTPPRRSHQLAESRQERLSRWRFDGMIAATALVGCEDAAHP